MDRENRDSLREKYIAATDAVAVLAVSAALILPQAQILDIDLSPAPQTETSRT